MRDMGAGHARDRAPLIGFVILNVPLHPRRFAAAVPLPVRGRI